MLRTRKISKIDVPQLQILKQKTTKLLELHKTRLTSLAQKNKCFLRDFKSNQIVALSSVSWTYSIVAELLFSTTSTHLNLFLEELRNKGIAYFFITNSEFSALGAKITAMGLDKKQLKTGGSLLFVATNDFVVYRDVLTAFLTWESDVKNAAINGIEILRVKENSSIISFSLARNEIRTLYDIRNTKRSILLETLNIINSSFLSSALGFNTRLSALDVAPVRSLTILFPFDH